MMGKSSSWGFGMSTARVSGSGSSAPKVGGLSKTGFESSAPLFGPIKGVPVGAWWRYRVQAAQEGVHRPLVASLHGTQRRGVCSLLFSAAIPEDVDLGEELYYTAASSGSRGSGKRKLISGGQLSGQSRALALNCATPQLVATGSLAGGDGGGNAGANWRDGLPVRLLRSGNGRSPAHQRSPYLPKVGVRYDGLYRVVKYWWEGEVEVEVGGGGGGGVWRFHLKRDDPEPAPWTEAGRYRARKNGFLTPVYPRGWTTEMAGKRRLSADLKILQRKAKLASKRTPLSLLEGHHPSSASASPTCWSIPSSISVLMEEDTAHRAQWTELRRLAEEQGKEV